MKAFSSIAATFGVSVALSQAPVALAAGPELVTAPVDKVFVPLGFDDNDNVEVVVHGNFPNTCYKIGPSKASVDVASRTITVDAKAYHYGEALCAQVIVPFTESIPLGIVPPGEYRVIVDNRPTAETNPLVVSIATSSDPDEYLYAPVHNAALADANNGYNVVVQGEYPFTFVGCMVMKEIRTRMTPGNVLVVLPIAELLPDGPRCDEQARTGKKFNITVPVTEPLGRAEYLIHVRSLGGSSVNRFVDLTTTTP